MFLNGYKKDALAMWVLGRAYEAADQRGLTADYRQMCLDRLDYMIRCMGGSSVWLVGHLGSPVGGKVAYGLANSHIQGLPRDGIMALLLRDSVLAQLLN